MTTINEERVMKIYEDCIKAVKDFLTRFSKGNLSVIKDLNAGLCSNIKHNLPYTPLPRGLHYSLVEELSVSWNSRYNSGCKSYPIIGGALCYCTPTKEIGRFYKGNLLLARQALARHLLANIDGYFERERDHILEQLTAIGDKCWEEVTGESLLKHFEYAGSQAMWNDIQFEPITN